MTVQYALDDGPRTAACPVCDAVHRLTRAGALWTHGKRTRRCRGSALLPSVARSLARRRTP